MSIPIQRVANPLFGQTTLAAGNNGLASWVRGETSPLDQKGSTGWLAMLTGGVQTGDDWARVNIPVDEIFVSTFTAALWSYYMTATETMGINIVIWAHDPNDYDNRVEITQLGGHADLPKASGWNAFKFTPATGGMFFYGENTAGAGLTAGTQYLWSQFMADALFKSWTIYRITIEYGWEASGTFDAAYVADIKLNGVAVPLQPGTEVVLSNAEIDIGDVTLLAGTALAGKFGIDQATANANEVVLKAGTALAGKFGIDQTTDGTTNAVHLKAGTADIGVVGHNVTGVADARATVTSAGTANVIAASTAAKSVIITAETNNTGIIVVGGSTCVAAVATRRGTPLEAGESMGLDCDNLNDIYIDSEVTGDGITFTYVT